MKNLFTLLLLCVLALPSLAAHAHACDGDPNCTVCTNCSRCRHCKAGGTCGVCAPHRATYAAPVVHKSAPASHKRAVHRISVEAPRVAASRPSKFEDLLAKMSKATISVRALADLTADQLVILRNAPYARHGYQFQNEDLRYFFRTQSWYHPKSSSQTQVQALLTAIERKNIKTVKKFEEALQSAGE